VREQGEEGMANYVAVAEAVRAAQTKTTLLREVIKTRAQLVSKGSNAPSGLKKSSDTQTTTKK
jgi:hypothetical protein